MTDSTRNHAPPLTEGRWMPNVSFGPPRQHWVPAGTTEIAYLVRLYQLLYPDNYQPGDGEDHYRALCGAICLRIPPGKPHYEWEEHEYCPTCRETTQDKTRQNAA